MYLYGKEVANNIKQRVLKKVLLLRKLNITPVLAIVQLTNDDSLNVYYRTRKSIGEELGIEVKLYRNENLTFEELTKLINDLNNDNNIWGIMIDEPFGNNFNKDEVISLIDPRKDVEGLSNEGKEYLFGLDMVIPPAQAIIEILKYYDLDMKNKKMCVIGGKGNCGREIVKALNLHYGEVIVCDKDTYDIPSVSSSCDLTIVSIGQKEFIDSKFVSENSILFDIGVHYNSNGKLCGDVQINAYEKAKHVCPSPKGIGPVTNVLLFDNLLKLKQI